MKTFFRPIYWVIIALSVSAGLISEGFLTEVFSEKGSVGGFYVLSGIVGFFILYLAIPVVVLHLRYKAYGTLKITPNVWGTMKMVWIASSFIAVAAGANSAEVTVGVNIMAVVIYAFLALFLNNVHEEITKTA